MHNTTSENDKIRLRPARLGKTQSRVVPTLDDTHYYNFKRASLFHTV